MGVYIKGMTYADALRLLAKDKKIIDTRNIIEVKEPHGRLVDINEINELMNRYNYKDFDHIDYYAPTVIEREGE